MVDTAKAQHTAMTPTRRVGVASVCPNCGVPVERKDLQPSISERFLAERTTRREAFKGK